MARSTRLPVEAFERGRGPDICFLSGESTRDRLNTTVESPDRYLWLIILGIVPYLVVRSLTRRAASGSIALSEEVYLQIKARRIRPAVPIGVAASGLVVGVLLLNLVYALGLALMAIGLIAGVVLAVVARRRDPLRWLSLDEAGRWVLIPRAADAYADAVSDDLRAGRL